MRKSHTSGARNVSGKSLPLIEDRVAHLGDKNPF